MNIGQAKQIPLEEILHRLGHSPTRQSGRDLWYRSPLRDETDPSFKVNANNQWYDFGTGEHGDLIDLVQKLFCLNTIRETLTEIARLVGEPLPPRSPEVTWKSTPASPTHKIIAVEPLNSLSLKRYLNGRGIPDDVACRHLKEIRYTRGDHSFFAIGFPNDEDAFEIRTKQFKGSLGQKSISTISGGPDHVAVFEGFIDYLTAVTCGLLRPDETVIVMNSTSLKDQVVEKLQELAPKHVSLWLDNDAAGRGLTAELTAILGEDQVTDQSNRYEGFDDLNAFHVAEIRERAL